MTYKNYIAIREHLQELDHTEESERRIKFINPYQLCWKELKMNALNAKNNSIYSLKT